MSRRLHYFSTTGGDSRGLEGTPGDSIGGGKTSRVQPIETKAVRRQPVLRKGRIGFDSRGPQPARPHPFVWGAAPGVSVLVMTALFGLLGSLLYLKRHGHTLDRLNS